MAFKYSYTTYMDAIVIFQSEYEYDQFSLYVKANIAHYEELYKMQGDEGLPHFPELEHLVMDAFKKEYRDALVMKNMLEDFRTDTTSPIHET